jgi:hypothetical protein
VASFALRPHGEGEVARGEHGSAMGRWRSWAVIWSWWMSSVQSGGAHTGDGNGAALRGRGEGKQGFASASSG